MSKFNNIDKKKKALDDAKQNYTSAIKEANMFKQMDHSENLMKVKRAQSAYKRHLAAKLVEKGSRGRDISERHKKLSELAKTTSQ